MLKLLAIATYFVVADCCSKYHQKKKDRGLKKDLKSAQPEKVLINKIRVGFVKNSINTLIQKTFKRIVLITAN